MLIEGAVIQFKGRETNPVIINGQLNDIAKTPITLKPFSGVSSRIITNCPIEFTGSAHFQIYSTSITAPNGLTIRGQQRGTRDYFTMIELMESAELPGGDVPSMILETGKIWYNNGTLDNPTSVLLPLGNCFINNIEFKGHEDGRHTIAVRNAPNSEVPAALNIGGCFFSDVDICVQLQREERNLSGIARNVLISNCEAVKFRVMGLDIDLEENIRVADCHFVTSKKVPSYAFGNSVYAPAMRFSNNRSRPINVAGSTSVNVEHSVVEANVDWIHWPEWTANEFTPGFAYENVTPLHPPSTPAMLADEDSYLIGVNGVSNFFLSQQSEVRNGFIGILAAQGREHDGCPILSNVTIRDCSNIHENYTGIVMLGGDGRTAHCKLYGGVIDFNTFGIYGQNVNIDANTVNQLRTNTFGISPLNGLYTCIDYTTFPTSNGVLNAPNNFWRSGTPINITNYRLDGNIINASGAASQGFDCFPFGGRIVNPNVSFADAPEEMRASVIVEGETKELLPIYWKGLAEYLNGDIDGAIVTMSEITSIPLETIANSTNAYVKKFHNTAWTIAPRTTSTTIGGSKIQANPSVKNKDMVIYPNPAADYFNISLPTGQYEMTLTDVLGRTIKQAQLNEFATINTEDMQTGVYQITIRKQGEKAIFQTGKVIVK